MRDLSSRFYVMRDGKYLRILSNPALEHGISFEWVSKEDADLFNRYEYPEALAHLMNVQIVPYTGNSVTITKPAKFACRLNRQYVVYVDRIAMPDKKRRYFKGYDKNITLWVMHRNKATLLTWTEATRALNTIVTRWDDIGFRANAELGFSQCLHISSIKHHE